MITPSFGLTATERVLPKLALDFTTASLDSRVTFTRTTGASNPATYVNSSGYITASTNNQPRFDYDPVTLACKGLLIEESRTNLVLQSEDFSTTWTSSAPYSVATNTAISPDGTQNADSVIVASGSTSFNANVTKQTATKAASAIPHTRSCYFKALGATTSVRLSDYGSSGTNSASVIVSLIDGSVITAPSVTGTFTSASVVTSNAGNGWWRVSFTYTTDTATSLTIRSFPYVGASQLTGDDTSGLYIWGAQLEAAAFATSYIPTTTAALTRNADVATMTGTNFSDWFNASEGTFTAKCVFNAPTSFGTVQHILSASDSTTSNRISIYRANATGNFTARIATGGVTANPGDNGVLAASTNVNVGIAYKVGASQGITGNASALSSASSPASLPTVTKLTIGCGVDSASQFLNGTYQKLFYYPQRLINTEVQANTK